MAVVLACAAAAALAAAPVPCPPRGGGAFTKQNITLDDPFIVVSVIPYGATITNLFVNDRDGVLRDVMLGFEDPYDYCANPVHPYFGATVGRVANRIANGTFSVNGRTYHLERTEKDYDNLHSGPMGFDRQVFEVAARNASSVTWAHRVPAGHGGFPGGLDFAVTMTVHAAAGGPALRLEHRGSGFTEDTLFNPTFHGYFNLDGFSSKQQTVLQHVLLLEDCEEYAAVDAHLIPTGELRAVARDAWMDFTTAKPLGRDIASYPAAIPTGYDTAFLARRARVTSPYTGLVMEVSHPRDSLQIYVSGQLDGTIPKKATHGGGFYGQYAGVTFEPQWLPDAINHPEWWAVADSTLVRRGADAAYATTYAFSIAS